MPVTLQKASEESRKLLKHLFSLYLHDLSEFADDLNIGSDGLFHYDGFDVIWDKEQLVPMLIYVDEQVAGFLLLCSPPYTSPDVDYCVHEFFILRKYRRKGIASHAVGLLFERYCGRYKIGQLKQNMAAVHFWKKIYRSHNIAYAEKDMVVQGYPCVEQYFQLGQR